MNWSIILFFCLRKYHFPAIPYLQGAMTKQLPLTDQKGEVRELTEKDFREATSFDVLPESLRGKLSILKTRG